MLPKYMNCSDYKIYFMLKGLISGSGRSPDKGNGNPLQYSCLENPTDRGACQAAVRGVRKESDMT